MWFLLKKINLPVPMKIRTFAFAVITIALAASSCVKLETLPEEPRIEFTSFTIFDTTDILGNNVQAGKLKFYFEDGDGDIGLRPPSGTEDEIVDTINLFLTLYRFDNGESSLAPDDDPYKPTGFRIPYMERLGRNTILQGHINVTLYYFFHTLEDSISYEFRIRDRAGNTSNTVFTPVIAVGIKGVYE